MCGPSQRLEGGREAYSVTVNQFGSGWLEGMSGVGIALPPVIRRKVIKRMIFGAFMIGDKRVYSEVQFFLS